MKRERKKRLTAAELKAAGVSREIVVRKIRPEKPKSPDPILSENDANDKKPGAARPRIERRDQDAPMEATGPAPTGDGPIAPSRGWSERREGSIHPGTTPAREEEAQRREAVEGGGGGG